jgi:hypothetical protein
MLPISERNAPRAAIFAPWHLSHLGYSRSALLCRDLRSQLGMRLALQVRLVAVKLEAAPPATN